VPVALGKGLLVGAAATGVMTGYQMLVARLRHQAANPGVPRTWAEAPAPAQVLKKVLGRKVTKQDAPMLTQAGHWLYGVSWGLAYALARPHLKAPTAALGAGLGLGLWGLEYAELTPLGISEPPWKYPAKELGLDLSYHLVYGAAAAAAYEGLSELF
jgi:hypothetical protein